MARIAVKYERPLGSGMYATYQATLADGRLVTINTQYDAVLPHHGHLDTCPQVTMMGGRCTCAANADIMALAGALIAEAHTTGRAEIRAAETEATRVRAAAIAADNAAFGASVERVHDHNGWCDRCGSYCYGDCTASES